MGIKHCWLSPRQTGELVKLLAAGGAAGLVGVHRNTAAPYFSKVQAMAATFDGDPIRRLRQADRRGREFGEAGVDQELVIRSEEEIFEMNYGCLCGTLRGNLIRILGNLMKRRGRFDSFSSRRSA